MVKKAGFDVPAAHKYFSAECFNRTWDYIDMPQRSSGEEDQMLALAFASLWHWTQREDSTPTNLSIGYWQVSRVLALIGQADLARHYGQLSLEVAEHEGVLPFYRGYAFEALARAEQVAGNTGQMENYLHQASQVANTLPDRDAKAQLLKDLENIPS